MVTLEQLVKEQKITGMSDIQIIQAFFETNDMEVEGMDLIQNLTKSKIEKMRQKERMVKDWTSFLPSKYLYEHYDLDTADRLHTLELDFLANGGELSNTRLKWAKENVPSIERPKAYFNPLVAWLEKKGILFEGENPNKNEDCFFEF